MSMIDPGGGVRPAWKGGFWDGVCFVKWDLVSNKATHGGWIW